MACKSMYIVIYIYSLFQIRGYLHDMSIRGHSKFLGPFTPHTLQDAGAAGTPNCGAPKERFPEERPEELAGKRESTG